METSGQTYSTGLVTKLLSHTLSLGHPSLALFHSIYSYFSPQVTYTFPTITSGSGPMAWLSLSQRKWRLSAVHTLTFHAHIRASSLPYLPVFQAWKRRVPGSHRGNISTGVLMMSPSLSGMQYFLWSTSPPAHFVILYFSFLKSAHA